MSAPDLATSGAAAGRAVTRKEKSFRRAGDGGSFMAGGRTSSTRPVVRVASKTSISRPLVSPAEPLHRKFTPASMVLDAHVSEGTKATLAPRTLAAAAGAGAPRAGIDNSLSFPDIDYTSNVDLARLLAGWLCGLGDQARAHQSVALFCEVKLREISSLAGHTVNPNRVRAAVRNGRGAALLMCSIR